ncbi:protease [Bovine adenovirus 7]|uniref:Protease n=2 Tax=Bovine adenovirus 7 TaxID=10511 RepID=PRO_ADEB7|nr:RecName: Full=Protease; AltName: Full=Adenain; AltName: Full=Adenovirus protease; Short=AVP; AltName: Full=Adenovirus proteinase; AltName: Full=Endoprotease [Bovine adenovirus 7]BCO10930.1 protease [Bovine adenovirus 7]BCS90523.1 protease [Bovine adenovirus 7]CAA37935.1 unnamed protein product [Bovine adenovirus 7]
MSGLSEKEVFLLLSSLQCTHGFLGTFDCRFPGFINKVKVQTAIINTGPREQGGIHWIALAWDPKSYQMFIFDPLGWKNDQLMKYYKFSYSNLIKRSALSSPDKCVKVIKNSQSVQCTCAGSCGLFCVFFLYCFYKYKSNAFKNCLFQSLYGSIPSLTPPNPTNLHKNQDFLYKFFKEKSLYFRQNEEYIVSNTKIGLIKSHI